MQTLTAAPTVSDPLVQSHFDRAASLYVDHALACYRTSVEQRLQLLSTVAGLSTADPISLLDVGCGGGAFLDLFLDHFTRGTATGVDISSQMLSRNLVNPRKTLMQGDALALPAGLGTYDVIAVDTVMHHLIARKGYAQTRERIRGFLRTLTEHLRPGGVLLIREIYHEYRAIENFGSRVIFELTTLNVPSPVAAIMRSAGLQTANVGVCFQTRAQWLALFAETGFTVAAREDHKWPGQPYRRFGFEQSGDLHYVLTRSRPKI